MINSYDEFLNEGVSSEPEENVDYIKRYSRESKNFLDMPDGDYLLVELSKRGKPARRFKNYNEALQTYFNVVEYLDNNLYGNEPEKVFIMLDNKILNVTDWSIRLDFSNFQQHEEDLNPEAGQFN